MKKIVIDTNVYISAILFGGNSKKIIDLIIEGKIKNYISLPILKELREKLEEKFKMPKYIVDAIIEEILNYSEIVLVFGNLKNVSIDPKDNLIVETGIVGKVNFIISGDHHLLDIKIYKNIKILTPAQFLKEKEQG